MFKQLLLLSGLILPLSGCAWAVRETTDQTVRDLTAHPFDLAPSSANSPSQADTQDSTHATARSGERPAAKRSAHAVLLASATLSPRLSDSTARAHGPAVPAVVRTVDRLESPPDPARGTRPLIDDQVQTVAWTGTQVPTGTGTPGATQRRYELHIPTQVPGSEAPAFRLPSQMTPVERDREIARMYPDLPSLPVEPKVQPGPGGKPYTLADFQRLAAANSPTLRQAAADVQAANGNLIQAMTYPNPITGYIQDTSAVNNTGGVQAGFVDQPVITGGKMKLSAAAAQKALDNAILALKRARSDLSTAVRNAYFTVLVDVETLIVTRALVQFSDEIFRLQVGLQKGAQFALYEPTALRAQTYLNRLAYKQAIAAYIYDWKALVATLGLPQLPLSEIAGQVDRFIPYYDYDEVRAYVLQNHTDILTARNGVKIAQYNLKLAQVTGVFPNLDVYLSLQKDFMNPPHGTYQALALGLPLPLWNQNKGNIIAAQGALVRATEESHRVEVTLTNRLALAYEGYRNNLYAMEDYRRNVLPNLVRYYYGVFARRQIDRNAAFGDLVFAQQNLTTNVTAYIGILGSLWSSVVSVADFLQTDDLFQLKKRRELPELPDFTQMPRWACEHATVAASCADGVGGSGPSATAPGTGLPPSGPAGGGPAVPPRPANPTDQPPSGPEGGAAARRDRGPDPDISPAAMLMSQVAKQVNRGSQAFLNAMAPVNAYFRKVGDQVGPVLLGPPAPVQSDSSADENYGGFTP